MTLRIRGSRSPRNWCSVRHRPTPSAPSATAVVTSAAVSALTRTPSRRESSAHASSVDSSGGGPATLTLSVPAYTAPVRPSSDTASPSRRTRSPIRAVPAALSTRSPSTPQTAGLPAPRATTAACEAMPPLPVSTAVAASIPGTSAGVVSCITRTVCAFGGQFEGAFAGQGDRACRGARGRGQPPCQEFLVAGQLQLRVQEFLHLGGADPAYRRVLVEGAVTDQVDRQAHRGAQRRAALRRGGEQRDLAVADLEVDGHGCVQVAFESEQGMLEEHRAAREFLQRFAGVRGRRAAAYASEVRALRREAAGLGWRLTAVP